jgi:hypothetical protein
MSGKISALCSVALTALAVGVATPAAAQAQSQDGTVTLTAEQWQSIQQELARLQQDVDQLKAAQQTTQTQAPQAEATAAQAQTAAEDAANAAPGPIADWAKDTKVGGRMYFNISNIDRMVDGAQTESGGGLLIKRFYIGIDHKFSDVLSGNITTDIDSVGSTGGSLVGKGLYVKKAYLQAKFAPQLAVRVGSSDLPWVPYVEGVYGYRHIENTMIDRTKFGTSADWGVHAMGDLAGGIVSYQVSAVDGGGYRDPKLTNTIDFEGRISARYRGFNAAVGGYIGKLGKDVDGAPPALHTATRLDALVAYKDERFTIGGEYFWAKNWTQVTALPSDEAEGWSAFGSVKVAPKVSLFGRYDWVEPRKVLMPKLEDRYFNAGVQYQAFRNVNLALVYKREKTVNGTIATSNGTIGGSTGGTYDEVGLFGSFQF